MAAENFQAPGIIVRELRAGVPQIRGTTTSKGAFIIRSLRGPVNSAIEVDSLAKAQRIFGDFDPNSYWGESVDGFFKNGGSSLYLSRIEPNGGTGSVKAYITLQNGGGGATAATKTLGNAPTYTLTPGMTVVVDVDNVGDATATWDAAAASIECANAETYALTDGWTLTVKIDQGSVQTITFNTADFVAIGAATAEEVAAVINEDLVGGSATATTGGTEVTITSDKKGTGSYVEVTGGTANGALGFSTSPVQGTGDVVDITAVTAAEFKTVMEADTTATVDITGTYPIISSPTTGASSELDFDATSTGLTAFGLSVEVIVGLASAAAANSVKVEAIGPGRSYNSVKVLVADEDNVVALAGSALGAAWTSGSKSSVLLTATAIAKIAVGDTIKLYDSAGGTQTVRAVVSQITDYTAVFQSAVTVTTTMAVATTNLTVETWSLTVIEDGKTIQGPFTGLRMSSLSSSNYHETRINTGDDEAVITVTDQSLAIGANSTDNRPDNTVATGDLLASGATSATYLDTDYIGTSSNAKGLYSLDVKKDVRLVAVPGVNGVVVTGAISKGLLDYCTAREDCVAVVSTPAATTVANAVTHKNTYLGATSYGIMIYPWVYILNPLTSQKGLCAPEGYYMGMVGRTDRERNVAKAPAGEVVGRLLGVLDIERELTDTDRATLYSNNINPIEDLDGDITVMGSRTMESGEFNQINVRRTFIFLRESLRTGTRFVLFEPNDSATRAKVKRVAGAFLKTEWERGNLEGDTIDEAFYVICDTSNNPDNSINEGKMFMSIGVNIPRTTEFLVIEIQQDQRGIEATLGF